MHRRRRRDTALRSSLTMLVLALLASIVAAGTLGAFSDTTGNQSNTFAVGTVIIDDNDSAAALLSLTNAKPGDSDTGCIVVTYSGSLAASVRLYGSTTVTGLDPYLNLVVTRGTQATPSFDDCTGFTADVTDYIGSGAGVVYSGTVEGFADDYASGIIDPAVGGGTESWTTGEAHAYQFTVTVQDSNAAQGTSATQSFIWEARNS